MEFPITEKYEVLEASLPEKYFNDLHLKTKFHYYDEIINFRVNELQKHGYKDVVNSYIDILNINKIHFHSWLEVDGYSTHVEFNLEKVYLNFTLLDFDAKLWFKGQSPEEIALWKTFRVFDTRPEIGDGKMAVFSIQEGVSPPNEPAIYYIDRASCWKTNLTFVQYYEAVLDMMGIADWQLLFSDVSLKDPMVDYYYRGLKGSLEALAKAFPDKDYSNYFELLEARWDAKKI
jgi:hypothetical protein